MRILIEPIPKDMRDHRETAECTSIATALDLAPEPNRLKLVAKGLTYTSFLDDCLDMML